MAKMRKKFDVIYLFPILFIVFPFMIFLLISFVRYIKTGIFNYSNNFIYFLNTIKSINEFIFPLIIYLTLGLLIVVLTKLLNKKIKILSWIMIALIGTIIILLGNRFFFILSNNLWSEGVFKFLLNGFDMYRFVLSSELSFLISTLLIYFDTKYLTK